MTIKEIRFKAKTSYCNIPDQDNFNDKFYQILKDKLNPILYKSFGK